MRWVRGGAGNFRVALDQLSDRLSVKRTSLENAMHSKRLIRGINQSDQKKKSVELNRNATCLEMGQPAYSTIPKGCFEGIVGQSQVMRKVFELITKAAASDANVLIYGESGTGKELVARAIHRMSRRAGGSFVIVNSGAIPENLTESEFFGYKKGAFTGACIDTPGLLDAADGGTLFLDEIAELTVGLQVKLLRVIEGHGYMPVGSQNSKTSDIRFLCASNRNLSDLMHSGRMREDFFYRIHVIPIQIPPLRERKDDLPLLIDHFVKQHAERSTTIVNGNLLKTFQNYDWPGNVRELENTLQRYFTLGKLDLSIPGESHYSTVHENEWYPNQTSFNLNDALARYEKKLIVSVLENHRGNREKAANQLNITVRTLYNKIKRFGLSTRN